MSIKTAPPVPAIIRSSRVVLSPPVRNPIEIHERKLGNADTQKLCSAIDAWFVLYNRQIAGEACQFTNNCVRELLSISNFMESYSRRYMSFLSSRIEHVLIDVRLPDKKPLLNVDHYSHHAGGKNLSYKIFLRIKNKPMPEKKIDRIKSEIISDNAIFSWVNH